MRAVRRDMHCWVYDVRSDEHRLEAWDNSPAPVPKSEVEWIRLGGLARLSDESVRIEYHRVLVDLRIVHEVPAHSRE